MLEDVLRNNRLLAFVGTGGVGKTTLSISVAIKAANMGLKVAAITIDPSKRLAKVLGLEDSSFRSIQWDTFKQPMDVYFLDTEVAFNEFVKESLKDSVFSDITKNKIYRQISKNLRETHNFSAIYQLEKILSQEQYDLIILDTPPSHQVIDFFQAPKQLQKFFTPKAKSKKSGLVSWIQEKSYDVVEGVMQTLAGKEFVAETENFLSQIGRLREDIYVVSQKFTEQMKSEKSQIFLICSTAKDKLEDAVFLQEQILKEGYPLQWCLMNRAYHKELDQSKEANTFKDPKEEELYNYFVGKRAKSLIAIEQLAGKACFKGTNFIILPELQMTTDTEVGLLELSRQVENFWSPIKGEK